MTPLPGEDEACWHALDAWAVLARLESGPAGLADSEHARRLAVCGPNIPEGPRRREPWWEELGESFTEPLQLLLAAVAVLSAVFGELRDAIAIAAVIAAVAVTETVTEMRAARAIEALRAMTAPPPGSSARAGPQKSQRPASRPATWWPSRPETSCPPTPGCWKPGDCGQTSPR